jgi:hypothetical protein
MNKKGLGTIVLLGTVWGISECALGIGLNACASSISGSVMTGVALFFLAAAWAVGRKAINVVLIVAIAIGFKMFDVLLLGLPLGSTAVIHPSFAFILEGAGLLIATAIFFRGAKSTSRSAMLAGGSAAFMGAAAFPLVRFVSGSPACVVPGSTIPLAWAYLPIALGISMLAVPLGIKFAEKSFRLESRSAWQIPAAVILGLGLIVFIRAVVPV